MSEDEGPRYKIEKGVPMPRPPQKYPWADMEVGDSFLAECAPGERGTVGNRLRNAAERFIEVRGLDWKFRYRSVEGGVRIWRVE